MIGTIQNLIIEHREVKGKFKIDRMCWRQLSDDNTEGGLVHIQRLVGQVFPLVTCSKLSQVAVVITHPRMKDKSILRGDIRYVNLHLRIGHLRLV